MNWKYAAAAAAVLLAFAGGAYVGRGQTPDTVEVEHVVHSQTVVTKTAYAKDAHEVRVVYRERKPDGTVTETEHTTTDTHERGGTVTDATTNDARDTSKTVTAYRPDWRIGVQAGGSLQTPLIPVAGPLVLGFTVDRRVIGPVWAGVWVQTGGAAGVGLSVEF